MSNVSPTLVQKTPSQADNPTYYALFRKDAVSLTLSSALRDQVFDNLRDAQSALTETVNALPSNLKNLIEIQSVPPPPVFNPDSDLRWYVTLD